MTSTIVRPFEPFRCAECGGFVRFLHASGEYRLTKHGPMKIPYSLKIPKCEKCGETYFSEDDGERIDASLMKSNVGPHIGLYIRCLLMAPFAVLYKKLRGLK